MTSSEGLCRLCGEGGDPSGMCELFGEHPSGKSYCEQIRKLMQIELEEDDSCPSYGCKICIQTIELILQFRDKVISNQERFQSKKEACKSDSPVHQTLDQHPVKSESTDRILSNSESPSELSDTEQEDISNKTVANPILDPPQENAQDSVWEPSSKVTAGPSNRSKRIKSSRKSTKSKLPPDLSDPDADPLLGQLNILKCPHCHRNHKTYQQLLDHTKRKHSSWPRLICCGRHILRCDLRDHLQYHRDKTSFACRECQKQFKTKRLKQNHDLAVHQIGDSDIQCDQCGKKFVQNYLLVHHKRVVHVEDKDRVTYSCSQCDKVYKTQFNLTEHVKRDHEKRLPYICEVCGKGFASNTSLRCHAKNHLNTSGQCDICLQYFGNVASHKRKTHNRKGPVECKECGKSFAANYLSIHTRQSHTERQEMSCTICGKMFYSKKTLKVHMDLHLGVVHPCRVCGREFGNSGNRTKHEKSHHPEDYERIQAEKATLKLKPPPPGK